MRIRSVHVRRFRSAESTGLLKCGGLNILIGKNNAGKSNILSAIELVMMHLRRGAVAAPWPTSRVKDEFTDRETAKALQIGIEFDLPETLNEKLRSDLLAESPNLEKSIEQISGYHTVDAIQQTIRGLLGVHVDAFQADIASGEGHAEMDVDQFLVEANGAGIREALRIVLDLELKACSSK